jgi:hypothetical protein
VSDAEAVKSVEDDRMNLCFSKVGFLAFIVMVINCTAEMLHKSQELQGVLNERLPSSQAIGLVYDNLMT